MQNSYTPDPMTPEWSQDLAEVRMSPFWLRWSDMERRDTFIEQASQYATYNDLPGHLKAIYQRAYRRLHSRR